jgi:hypothetical protein
MIEEKFIWNPMLTVKMFEIEIPEGYRSIREKTAADGAAPPGDR